MVVMVVDFGFYLVLWILAMGFVVYGCGCGCDGWLSWLVVVVTGGDGVVVLFLFFLF